MKIPVHQVDAFTQRVFGGNPAAVCPLPHWLDEDTLQNIAAENNVAETAFYVPRSSSRKSNTAEFELRWLTPSIEVDLCGHGTLATAFVIFSTSGKSLDEIIFHTKSGPLTVRRDGERFTMNFPLTPAEPCTPPPALLESFAIKPIEVLKGRQYVAVFNNEEEIRNLAPDFEKMRQLDLDGIVATAKGNDADFVSRFFVPDQASLEDPVTGSTHCTMAPYWAPRLGKNSLHAQQLSKRKGDLFLNLVDDRLEISGHCVSFLRGEIDLPEAP